MVSKVKYGQYCPLAMSSEFLCNRWTLLILRELLAHSSSFNDIARGVPRMSRTLLSSRLKELVKIGIITRSKHRKSNQVHYILTDAGRALEDVVVTIAGWGQQWLEVEPSLKDLDVGMLMWDIRRNAVMMDELPNPFVVHFFLLGVPDNQTDYWLVYENNEIDLCHIDEGFDVDVEIEVDAKTLTKVWMGWECFDKALSRNDIIIRGPFKYTSLTETWLGKSIVADTPKLPPDMRVNY